jgi:hypothetical protein
VLEATKLLAFFFLVEPENGEDKIKAILITTS